MAEPVHTRLVADAVTNQMLSLINANLKLRLARALQSNPQVSAAAIKIQNQSLASTLSEIHHQILLSLNKNAYGALKIEPISQIRADYKSSVVNKTLSLKSLILSAEIVKQLPVIEKLKSLNLNFFQASNEIHPPQANVVFSIPFPNAPLSSEYFKFFELFHKRNLPLLKKKKKRSRSDRKPDPR